jgi:putative nucleotidyltransferase-like protein
MATTEPITAEAGAPDLWSAVDRLIDRAAQLEDLRRHGLQLLAGRRWRLLGRPLEAQLLHDEQLAAAVTLTVPIVVERVRAAYDGLIVIMKGPEIAGLYPSPRLRPYSDVDLLVDDAERAQRALLAAGFRPVGDPRLYVDIHHLRPVVAPGLAVAVEIHDRPKWPDGLSPPPTEELLARAVPATLPIDGVGTLPAPEHALLLAVHSWAHVPLVRISHLLDVNLMADGVDRAELQALARRWDVPKLWLATATAAEALFQGRPPSWPLRTWARNLRGVRERTVLESHLERWLAPFSAASPRRAIRASATAMAEEAQRQPGEAWRVKLHRTGRALRSPSVRLSEHHRALAERELQRVRRGRAHHGEQQS